MNKIIYFLSFIFILAGISGCNLKQHNNNQQNTQQQASDNKPVNKSNITNEERDKLSGIKMTFSHLAIQHRDGTVENLNVNTEIIFNDKIFDAISKTAQKPFPFNFNIENTIKKDSVILLKVKANNLADKIIIKNNYTSVKLINTKLTKTTPKETIFSIAFRK